MESMKYLMRYNDYKNDNYSLGNPMNAICSRPDLQNPPRAGGCFDTKVSVLSYSIVGFVTCLIHDHSRFQTMYIHKHLF